MTPFPYNKRVPERECRSYLAEQRTQSTVPLKCHTWFAVTGQKLVKAHMPITRHPYTCEGQLHSRCVRLLTHLVKLRQNIAGEHMADKDCNRNSLLRLSFHNCFKAINT